MKAREASEAALIRENDVNRHEDLEETCSHCTVARSISFSLYGCRNDHPITSSNVPTHDRIDCALTAGLLFSWVHGYGALHKRR